MKVTMTPLEIIGLKTDLPAVVHSLQRLGCVHIGDLNDLPGSVARPLATDRETTRAQEELKLTATKVDGLLTNLLGADSPRERPGPGNEASHELDDNLAQARDSIAELTPRSSLSSSIVLNSRTSWMHCPATRRPCASCFPSSRGRQACQETCLLRYWSARPMVRCWTTSAGRQAI